MMKKRIITGLAALMISGAIGITAFASEQHSAEEIEEFLWEENWHGKGDNGLVFPEASYKHHILEQWINENYDDIKGTPLGELRYKYGRYYKRMMKDWDFNDDDNGNWTIVTPDDEYHFSLLNGDWQMINKNGDTVDTFPPFSTLRDDETSSQTDNGTANANEGNGGNGNRVIGEMPTTRASAAQTQDSSMAATEPSSTAENSGSSAGALLGGAAVVAVGAAGFGFAVGQKKGKGKK